MHILQVIPHYVPAFRFGGPQHVAHGLGKALFKAGHSVTVCTTNLADENSDLSVTIGQPLCVDGVTVYYEPTVVSRYWGFSPKLFQRCVKEIKIADLVIIHAHFQFANWVGALLARRARKRYIIFPHGSLHRQGISHKNSFLKKLYLRTIEYQNFRNAIFIAFNAEEERKLSWLGELGEVVPNGIDISSFDEMPETGYFRKKYPEMQGKLLFLFLGRLDIQHKGLDLLLPAFGRLKRLHPNIHLFIAGPNENDGEVKLKALIDKYDLASVTTIGGMITGNSKLAALQDADIFVQPSRFEGMSIALLEALFTGLPVLVTDQVGMSEEIRSIGAGIVVKPNIESIYDGLLDLCDITKSANMRGKGITLIKEKYSWDAIARNLVEKIEEVAKI